MTNTNGFVLKNFEDGREETRVAEIEGRKFRIIHDGHYNLWSVTEIDVHSGPAPKEFAGKFTSQAEALKAVSMYTARMEELGKSKAKAVKANGDSTAQHTDSGKSTRA